MKDWAEYQKYKNSNKEELLKELKTLRKQIVGRKEGGDGERERDR